MKIYLFISVLIVFSILGLGNGNYVPDDEIQKYKERFLFLKNVKKYCEKDHLLLAQSTDNLFNLSKLLDICESKKECDFIIFAPQRQLRNSIHYEDEAPLKNTGANWVCSGDDWFINQPRKQWIIAIKNENIQKQMKFYNLTLNVAAECDENSSLMKIKKLVTPNEASQECDRISNCRYIIFNYSTQIGKNNSDNVKAILCSKLPLGRTDKLGFLLAEKKIGTTYKHPPKSEKKEINLKNAKGGPITGDAHYKNFEKGQVIYSDKEL